MKKTIHDYIDTFVKIIIVLVAILVIYWLIQLIFGGSPTISQINFGLIIGLVGLIVHLYFHVGKFSQFVNGTFPRFEKNVENSFNRIREDMSLIKKKLKI